MKNIVLRKAVPEDAPFIFNSWLKSFRKSPLARNICSTVYFSEHHKVIERLLRSCDVTLACNPDDPTQLYGYAVMENKDGVDVFHYIYVKHTFRRLGIAKTLKDDMQSTDAASVYTHHTQWADRIAPRYNMVYSPYVALTPDYREAEDVQETE
jgi:GNAT superfamily N-acetyltransferase